MTNRQEFTQFLQESLHQKEHAWLNPGIDLNDMDATPEILLPNIYIHDLLTQMRQHPGVGACRASFRFQNTLAIFSMEGWDYSINFMHKMVSKNLFFLEEEEVLGRRVKRHKRMDLPCVEHLLEYSVLKSFLNREGIAEEDYLFFREFHILVQEDLIEFCNEKYNTFFSDIYALTQYRPEVKSRIINRLREMPLNRLTKIINIRWHNFLGSVRREARMI